MRTGFLILILAFAAAINLRAQCEGCKSVAGEVIDFCFIESDWPDHCVQFTEDAAYFYYQSPTFNKGIPLKLQFPDDQQATHTNYFVALYENHQKLKLGPRDLLIMEHGLDLWREMEGVRKWDKACVFSEYTFLPSGLAYKPLVEGKGKFPEKGKNVTVHYTGYLESGKKFDSSYDRKQSFQFTLGAGQVIKGWDEGLAIMRVGGRYLLRIPPQLGYGQAGAGGGQIPPNATLIFDIQLLSAE
jgi:hypothetical protein